MTPYCTADGVRANFGGDVPNIGPEYTGVLTKKCDQVSSDIDRMVTQARGISGPWSFVADSTATERLFLAPAGSRRFLPIDDAVEITQVRIYAPGGAVSRTLVAGTNYRPWPLNGALPITALLWAAGAWPELPYLIGVTAKWGYGLNIPPDVQEAAEIEVIRSYLADRAGQDDRIGMSPFGSIITAKAFTSKLKQLVSDYSHGAGFLR